MDSPLILLNHYGTVLSCWIRGLNLHPGAAGCRKVHNHFLNVSFFLTSALMCCANCTFVCTWTNAYTAHTEHVHVSSTCLHSWRGRVMAWVAGEWQLSAGKTNRLRATERAQSPGTPRNILSTGLPGSTPDTAPGTASLRSQTTASEPHHGGDRPEGCARRKSLFSVWFQASSNVQEKDIKVARSVNWGFAAACCPFNLVCQQVFTHESPTNQFCIFTQIFTPNWLGKMIERLKILIHFNKCLENHFGGGCKGVNKWFSIALTLDVVEHVRGRF